MGRRDHQAIWGASLGKWLAEDAEELEARGFRRLSRYEWSGGLGAGPSGACGAGRQGSMEAFVSWPTRRGALSTYYGDGADGSRAIGASGARALGGHHWRAGPRAAGSG